MKPSDLGYLIAPCLLVANALTHSFIFIFAYGALLVLALVMSVFMFLFYGFMRSHQPKEYKKLIVKISAEYGAQRKRSVLTLIASIITAFAGGLYMVDQGFFTMAALVIAVAVLSQLFLWMIRKDVKALS